MNYLQILTPPRTLVEDLLKVCQSLGVHIVHSHVLLALFEDLINNIAADSRGPSASLHRFSFF